MTLPFLFILPKWSVREVFAGPSAVPPDLGQLYAPFPAMMETEEWVSATLGSRTVNDPSVSWQAP